MAVFVLVPGGDTGSWIWREVARALKENTPATMPMMTG